MTLHFSPFVHIDLFRRLNGTDDDTLRIFKVIAGVIPEELDLGFEVKKISFSIYKYDFEWMPRVSVSLNGRRIWALRGPLK